MNISARERGADKAESSPILVHLPLHDLRKYRNDLTDEKERVSYWCRLVQSLLDALAAPGGRSVNAFTSEDLARALGPTGSGHRRRSLLAVHAGDDLPDLPGLDVVYRAAQVDQADAEQVDATQDALITAQSALTAYQRAVRARLSAATSELITRYMQNPAAALDLLEEPPHRR